VKYFFVATALIGLLLFSTGASAQHRGGGGTPGDDPQRYRHERLEKFRKMRLIEVLKLNEEESVRFFAKQSAHEDKVGSLMKMHNEALDSIDNLAKAGGDGGGLLKGVDRVLDIDQQIFAERQRYHDEIRKFLGQAKFAKFLVFERDFGRQVRDAFEEMRRERRSQGED